MLPAQVASLFLKKIKITRYFSFLQNSPRGRCLTPTRHWESASKNLYSRGSSMSLEIIASLWDAETKVSFLSVFLSFLLFLLCVWCLVFCSILCSPFSLFFFFFLSLHCTFSTITSHSFFLLQSKMLAIVQTKKKRIAKFLDMDVLAWFMRGYFLAARLK